MKRFISTALVIALLIPLFSPSSTSAQQQPPPKIAALVCGVVVLGVGAVVVWNLYRLCKKLPPPDSNPDATNAPPKIARFAISPATDQIPPISLDDSAVQYQDITAQNFTDSVSGLPFTARLDCVLWTSADTKNWSVQYRITGWSSTAGVLFLFSDPVCNPVLTNYCDLSVSSAVPLDIGTGQEPVRFFKMTAP